MPYFPDPYATLPDPEMLQLGAEANQEFLPAAYRGHTGLVPFAGIQPMMAPTTLGSGLLAGLVSGLGRAGTRQALAQQQFQQSEAQRRAAFDQNRLAAQKELRQLTGQGRRDLLKQQAEDRKARQKFEQDNPILSNEQIAAAPWLARVADAEGRVPRDVLAKAMAPQTATSAGRGLVNEGDAGAIADAIEQGLQPPDMKGLYRFGGPVRAELGRRGYDMTAANKDWLATQRTIATLNGPQQTRLRQAVNTAYESLDVIDQLNERLQKLVPRTSVRLLNHAGLTALKNLPGEAGVVARELDGQITDVVSELGNAYMGGNSPTDHALQLSAKNLDSNWSFDQLKAMTALARKNLGIRRNSIELSTQPIVPGATPPVNPAAGGNFDVLAPNGKTYRFRTQEAANEFRRKAGIP